MKEPPLHLIKLFNSSRWHVQTRSGWATEDMTLCMDRLSRKQVERSTTTTDEIECSRCLKEMETRSDSALWIEEPNTPVKPPATEATAAAAVRTTSQAPNRDDQGSLF